MNNKILICDGQNNFIRHYIANPALSLNGEHAGGIVGFIGQLASVIRQISPSKVIVVWESGGNPRRRSIYPEYKEGRKPPKMNRYYKGEEEELPDSEENKIWQIEHIVKILNYLPIVQLYIPDSEADDVIGYLCRYKYKDSEKIIMSSDKDFYQLLDDKTVVWKPSTKGFVKSKDVLEEFSISPRNFCLAKAICGDDSDNIPGVNGVGFKILANRFKQLSEDRDITIDEIVTQSEFLSKEKKPLKIYTSIVESGDIIKRNWKLMYLDTAMLQGSQIRAINDSLDTFTSAFSKLKIHEETRNLGLPQMDVERICDSVSYLVYQK